MTSLGLHGVNTTTKSNVSFLAMAEGTAVSSVSSVVSDRGPSEEDDAKYSSLVRPYQDEPLPGEDTESVEDQPDVDGLFPRTPQGKYEILCLWIPGTCLPVLFYPIRVLSEDIGVVNLRMSVLRLRCVNILFKVGRQELCIMRHSDFSHLVHRYIHA